MKNFIIIILVIAAVFGGGSLLKKDKPVGTGVPTNNVIGKGTSGVTLVEYGDFQCPNCGAFFPILKQVKAHYKDEIKFQFVNFPLTQIHQNALAASRAAQAAAKQGKFWEMHDALFTNQNSWGQATNPSSGFESYATQLGLDMTKYRKDFASAETNAVINADIATGQKLKVTSTASFFLDGKKIEDNTSISTPEKFIAAIDAAILAKTGKPSISKAAITAPEPTAPAATSPAEPTLD